MASPAPEVVALRTLIERSAAGDRDAAAVRRLGDLRADVAALLGQIDQYLNGRQLQQEGAALTRKLDLERARQRADIREELEAEGRFDGKTLDSLGYLSHGRLDELDRDGLLEAALEESPTLPALSAGTLA